MAFTRDAMSPTGLAGPGATSVMPKGGDAAVQPKPMPVPANNQPMKATPQGVTGAAAAQSQAPMPPLYEPGVNGPVVNSSIPSSIPIKGSPMTPQPGQVNQVGQFLPPSVQALMQPKAAEILAGGKADSLPASIFPQSVLRQGQQVEMEHTDSKPMATEIAKDHLAERPDYYTQLAKVENAPLETPGGSQEGSDGSGSILRRLFGFERQKASQEVLVVDVRDLVKRASMDLTNYRLSDEVPVRWGKWRMEGLEALDDLERHMTTRARNSGFRRPQQEKSSAGPFGIGADTNAQAEAIAGGLGRAFRPQPSAASPLAGDVPAAPKTPVAGRSLAELLPFNPSIFEESATQIPEMTIDPPNLSPRSLNTPSPASKPMVPSLAATSQPVLPSQSPLTRGGWADNPEVRRRAMEMQTTPSAAPPLQETRVKDPIIGQSATVEPTPNAAATAKLLSPVSGGSTVPATSPSSEFATPTPAPTPTPTPTPSPAPVGRFTHLIAGLQQKIPEMEARLAGVDPASRQYRNLKAQIDSAKFRMRDLDQRQWKTVADYRGHSPEALARFQTDAAKYQTDANAYASSVASGSAPAVKPVPGSIGHPAPAPAPASGTVAAATKPAGPPQTPKMAELLDKISTYPGCGMHKRKKKRAIKRADSWPDISTFAAAFFIKCCENGMGADDIRSAIKTASARLPAVADELAVLLRDDCPVLDGAEEFSKIAGGWAEVFKGLLGYGDDLMRAGKGMFTSAPMRQLPSKLPWSSLDEIGGAAAGARPAGAATTANALADTVEFARPPSSPMMPSPATPQPRWRGTPPPTAPRPQGSPPGGGGAPPTIRPSAPTPSPGPVPPAPAVGPAAESWWNRNLLQPGLGGLGGAGFGNAVNYATDAMFGFQVPGLPYATAALGTGLRTPMVRNRLLTMQPGMARSLAGGAHSLLSGAGDVPEGAATRWGNRAMTAAGVIPPIMNVATGQEDWYSPSQGTKTFMENQRQQQMNGFLQENFGMTAEDLKPIMRVLQTYKKDGILGALKAGWGELTPQQKAGLVMAIGGPLIGIASAAMGHPWLGAAAGLGGLGAGGYMMYQGGGDPVGRSIAGLPQEQQQAMHDIIGSNPEFFDEMRARPRAEQHSGIQDLIRQLQEQQAGAELARASGQPVPAQ